MKTPNSNRPHIGIFGRVNVGKSTILNLLTGQKTAITSDTPGATTDPIYKAMELEGAGPVVFIDTGGLLDKSELGSARKSKTIAVSKKCDGAILVFARDFCPETAELKKKLSVPVIAVINDFGDNKAQKLANEIKTALSLEPIIINALNGPRKILLESLKNITGNLEEPSLIKGLAKKGDLVVLVMPQDRQAPKGRLILPQVQTLRELLDAGIISVCCVPENFAETLRTLNKTPDLIICDSQVFNLVYEQAQGAPLTSFSVLMTGQKGDAALLLEGAKIIATLNANSRVLIAEACTHAPIEEDIGKIKIPRMLRAKYGNMKIDFARGDDFPETNYDLIIHCGACMFNRRFMQSRIEQSKKANIPITNYGMALAFMQGILDKIITPI